jgi:peptidoglycan/LPS O-acetylase OafA/YrhL
LSKQTHYAFLDGVRAIAALYVFVYHAYRMEFRAFENNALLSGFAIWGYEAVVTFIVLSGFCLGLKIERAEPFWSYIGRRSRRLLPPYYAALALLCLLVIAAALRHGIWMQFPLSHLLPNLFLVRELFPDPTDWLVGSTVFWSIGIEYRLYWLVPVFGACYRRWGLGGLGLSAIALYLLGASILAALHLPNGHLWLLFAFVFGVAAAQSLDRAVPIKYPVLAIGTLFLLAKAHFDQDKIDLTTLALTDLLFAVVIALLLQAGARVVKDGRSNRAIALLSHPLLGWVATWSYSLYLTHYALLSYARRWLGWQGITGWSAILFQTIPVLCGCWLFSLAFERPFLRKPT